MVVGYTTTYAISAYHHLRCEFEFWWWRGVLDTTLCDKVCQWFATGRWFSPTNNTDRHDITETVLLKVALNIISYNPNPNPMISALWRETTEVITTYILWWHQYAPLCIRDNIYEMSTVGISPLFNENKYSSVRKNGGKHIW
jgi:hypothetical protein